MSDAFTARQVTLLRTIRDTDCWYQEPGAAGDLQEAVFLCSMGLLDYVGPACGFSLSLFGRVYLGALEAAPE
jgi:hypothetical protein